MKKLILVCVSVLFCELIAETRHIDNNTNVPWTITTMGPLNISSDTTTYNIGPNQLQVPYEFNDSLSQVTIAQGNCSQTYTVGITGSSLLSSGTYEIQHGGDTPGLCLNCPSEGDIKLDKIPMPTGHKFNGQEMCIW